MVPLIGPDGIVDFHHFFVESYWRSADRKGRSEPQMGAFSTPHWETGGGAGLIAVLEITAV